MNNFKLARRKFSTHIIIEIIKARNNDFHINSFRQIPQAFLTIFLALIFSNVSVYSQVKIKEKVIINPEETKQKLKKELSVQSGHSVKVQISMSSNAYCYFSWSQNMTICGTAHGTATIQVPGSSVSIPIEGEAMFDQAGTYYYNISWALDNGVTACHQNAEIKAFLDENLIYNRTVEDVCSTWGQFTVSFPQCDPECTSSSPPVAPTFTFSPTTDDKYCGKDFGYTAYDKNEIFNNYQIELCYNSSLDQWITKLNNSNKAVFKYYSGLCENKINSYPFVVRNINDIKNLPPNEICRAKSDFEATYQYPLHGSTYIFRELIEKHENLHEKNLTDLFTNMYNNQYKFGDQFLAFKLKCEQTNGFNDAKNQAETFANNLINNFRNNFDKKWTALYGDSQSKDYVLSNKWYAYEKKTQEKAYDIVWKKYKRIFDRCSK